ICHLSCAFRFVLIRDRPDNIFTFIYHPVESSLLSPFLQAAPVSLVCRKPKSNYSTIRSYEVKNFINRRGKFPASKCLVRNYEIGEVFSIGKFLKRTLMNNDSAIETCFIEGFPRKRTFVWIFLPPNDA